jgi:hypothetical protein
MEKRIHLRFRAKNGHSRNGPLRAVYTRVFCVRFSVRDGAAAFLCFSRTRSREKKQRKLMGGGAITDGEMDARTQV